MLSDYSLQEIIEGEEWMYYEVNTREFGKNSLRRGGYLFEDRGLGDVGGNYVSDIITADLIIKNENCLSRLLIIITIYLCHKMTRKK